MATAHPLKVLGAPGSPYSRKLRAVLRFRRIPHLWILRGSKDEGEVPEIRVRLMPVLVFPGPEGRYDAGLRGKLNVGYPAGATAYFRYLDEWRHSGVFEGLEFRAATQNAVLGQREEEIYG
jgi:hypothetical protein